MSVAAEGAHVKGERGVMLAKRLLESTTHIRLPFSAYDETLLTTLVRLDKNTKRFDLVGYFLREKPHQLAVEVKHQDHVSHQGADYTEFLANAYSITAYEREQLGGDPQREFMYVTWHPFSLNKWPRLTSAAEVEQAVVHAHPEALGGQLFDRELAAAVASRLWLLVLSEKQTELVLTPEELHQVFTVVKRKGA